MLKKIAAHIIMFVYSFSPPRPERYFTCRHFPERTMQLVVVRKAFTGQVNWEYATIF